MVPVPPHLYRTTGAAQEASLRSSSEEPQSNRPTPKSLGFPAILTLRHLAHLTGAKYDYLRSVITRNHAGYRTFSIRKRSGGERLIACPEPTLAAVQRWIIDNVLTNCTSHQASCAYSKEILPPQMRSTAPSEAPIDHQNRYTYFFENISERRVYFVFRSCGYQPLVSFELARLCTRVSTGKSAREERWRSGRNRHDATITTYHSDIMGHLPQGAPSSPLLSNLASKDLDKAIKTIADDRRLLYTRYSDDLVFSTQEDIGHARAASLVHDLERVLASSGHSLHRKKTTILPPGARKIVLGLLVDGQKLKLDSRI